MKDGFFRFDAHVHVGAWKTPDFAGRASGLEDVAGVLESAGITGALLMPTDAGDNGVLVREILDLDTGLTLLFAAWIDPGDPGLVDFLRSNIHDVKALKFHPSFVRKPITDPAFAPYLDLASKRGLPAVVHCGRWREVAGYELALEAAAKHRGASFVLSHMGGDSPGLVIGAARAIRERRLDNVYLGTESIREYWLVRKAVEIVGPERVVFGSDHNLNHPSSFLAVVEAMGLGPADKDLILGGNARRILTVS